MAADRSPGVRRLLQVVAKQARNHPFSCRGNIASLLPAIRNLIALEESLPSLLSAPIHGELNCAADIIDARKWKEDKALVEANDRKIAYEDRRSWELMNFADYLRDESAAKGDSAIRRYFCNRLGWPLLPDFGPATIAYLALVKLGLRNPNDNLKKACRLALQMSATPIAHALRRSLARSLDKGIYEVKPIPITFTVGGSPEPCVRSDEFGLLFEAWVSLNIRWCRDAFEIFD